MTDTNRKDRSGFPVVPCKWCGRDTAMTGTQLCHRCWELDSRIRRDPKLAEQILTAIQEGK